jgi:hypothetical protein
MVGGTITVPGEGTVHLLTCVNTAFLKIKFSDFCGIQDPLSRSLQPATETYLEPAESNSHTSYLLNIR